MIYYLTKFQKVTLDLELILGTLGARREYTQDGNASSSLATTHTFTPIGNLPEPSHLLACLWVVGLNRKTWRKPTQTREYAQKFHTGSNLSSRSNQGSWSDEAAIRFYPLQHHAAVWHKMKDAYDFCTNLYIREREEYRMMGWPHWRKSENQEKKVTEINIAREEQDDWRSIWEKGEEVDE